jgi:RHS repeat-associated protein
MADKPGKEESRSEARDPSFVIAAPQLSLPKGGGAIRGIGEKFAANPVSGTGSLTVPIYTSPGRSGFGPQLSLSYDSGAGNGPFGFGWSLALPSLTRKTDKGLPQYADVAESDIFILSGAEDLVPLLVENNGQWERDIIPSRTVYGNQYRIHRYRPRVEGLFARVERWVNLSDPQDTFWRSISRDNVTTWYGKTVESRITDPDDSTHVFSWLICESYDDKGNVSIYRYKPEDSGGVDLTQVHERNRSDATRSANRYLKHVLYGNRTPYLPDLTRGQPIPLPTDWCFELVFDFGEHDETAPVPQEKAQIWDCRADPFSTYRATFEVRTYRLCRRALMFHHFATEPGVGLNCLVRSTDFAHSQAARPPADPTRPFYSFLLSVTQTGYSRHGSVGYLSKALPPLEFQYTEAIIDETVREIDPGSLENLPYGLDSSHYQWVDLDGEGLSGILTEQAGSWFYKSNLSPVNQHTENGVLSTRAQFGPVKLVARQPSLAALSRGQQQLLDLSGDGQLDLVQFDGPTPGFFERTEEEGWETFTTFQSLPVLDWRNPNLKFVDFTGDGHADLLISEDNAFLWHTSLAASGFGAAHREVQALDEERGPKLILADGTESIFLADVSGDGLTDLVRIRNGEVCYWPNLGYGRFGAKVVMDRAPWFEAPDLFDGRRIRLADIDGSGTTDIVYFASGGVHPYFNQSGNGFGERRVLSQFPPVESVSSATALDLLGTGTACLVWSSPLPGEAAAPLRYVDLMGGQKPHLMIRSRNNLGAETRLRYAPSTRFYLADKMAGKPWITRLPHLVHVVERVDVYDWIGRSRFITRYAYHHGHFDGYEREFRGFGMVEQWDTEEHRGDTDFPGTESNNWDQTSWTPPMHTRTWFHTGAFAEATAVSRQYEHEYWTEPALRVDNRADDRKAMLLADTVLPPGLTPDEVREAYRALKGMALRTEIYAKDGSPRAAHPYTVTEQNFTLRLLQPEGPNWHAVFFAHPREKISFDYERHPDDPRVTHDLTLEVDPFGNVKRSVSVGYPRRADYAPWIGRWTSCDPAALVDGANLYTYCRSSPTALKDPAGTKATLQDPPPPSRPVDNRTSEQRWTKQFAKALSPGGLTLRTSIFLSRTTFEVLKEALGTEGEHVSFRSREELKQRFIEAHEGGKVKRISIPEGFGLLRFEPFTWTPPGTPPAQGSFLWGLLAKVVESQQRVFISAPENGIMSVTEHVSGSKDTRLFEKPIGAISGERAYTAVSEDLQVKVYGGMVERGKPLSYISPFSDLSVIYLLTVGRTGGSALLAHELLGHFYMAVQGLPFGKDASLSGRRILDRNTRDFECTVHQFIYSQVEPEVESNLEMRRSR